MFLYLLQVMSVVMFCPHPRGPHRKSPRILPFQKILSKVPEVLSPFGGVISLESISGRQYILDNRLMGVELIYTERYRKSDELNNTT